MASYIDLAPFPLSFTPNGQFSDHFRPFLDFGDFSHSIFVHIFDKYMSLPSDDTHMGQPGG